MEIPQVLEALGKSHELDQYNCGVCGYPNCVSHAQALIDGVAEVDQCLPYLLDRSASYLVAQERKHTEKLENLRMELDAAFALTLPDRRVETQLRSIVEYEDEYLDNGLVRILRVEEQGGYRHVINSLKVLATLRAQGVMDIIGIHQETLVKAIIFHDLGKVQPQLKPGDIVDP